MFSDPVHGLRLFGLLFHNIQSVFQTFKKIPSFLKLGVWPTSKTSWFVHWHDLSSLVLLKKEIRWPKCSRKTLARYMISNRSSIVFQELKQYQWRMIVYFVLYFQWRRASIKTNSLSLLYLNPLLFTLFSLVANSLTDPH